MDPQHDEDFSDIRSNDLSDDPYDIDSDSAFAPSHAEDTDKYIDPNDLVCVSRPNSRVTFGYIDGKLIYHVGIYQQIYSFATHSDLWRTQDAKRIINKLRASGRIPLQKTTRDLFHLFGLFGRIGILKDNKNIQKVSFWNHEQSSYNKYLGDCMNKIEGAGFLTQKTIIVTTPLWTKEWDRDTDTAVAMDTKRDVKKDAEAKRQAKLRERMHLATGAEKRKIMKDLKLGFTTRGEHPMTKAMSQKGLLIPGAKWWAPQSESFSDRLETSLFD